MAVNSKDVCIIRAYQINTLYTNSIGPSLFYMEHSKLILYNINPDIVCKILVFDNTNKSAVRKMLCKSVWRLFLYRNLPWHIIRFVVKS